MEQKHRQGKREPCQCWADGGSVGLVGPRSRKLGNGGGSLIRVFAGHSEQPPVELPVLMRMVWFRRFECAKINVEAPAVALIGPTESGKTSLLRVPAPSKRAIASRVLEITARNPKRPGLPILDERYTTALRELHQSLRDALQVLPSGNGTV